MKLQGLFCIVMITTSLSGFAQDRDTFFLQGTVIDSVTNAAITDVHITSKKFGVISDRDGGFEIRTSAGDTIFLSHTSYKRSFIVADPLMPGVTIWLAPRVRVLKEVRISAFPSEAEFKQQLLMTVPTVSREVAMAAENSERMRDMGRFAPMTKTNADLFFESLQGPQGFTLLSSNPSRGISGFIKSVRRPQKYQYRDWRIPAGDGHPIRVRRVIPSDTVIVAETDSLSMTRKR
jgi:hypothetical protein